MPLALIHEFQLPVERESVAVLPNIPASDLKASPVYVLMMISSPVWTPHTYNADVANIQATLDGIAPTQHGRARGINPDPAANYNRGFYDTGQHRVHRWVWTAGNTNNLSQNYQRGLTLRHEDAAFADHNADATYHFVWAIFEETDLQRGYGDMRDNSAGGGQYSCADTATRYSENNPMWLPHPAHSNDFDGTLQGMCFAAYSIVPRDSEANHTPTAGPAIDPVVSAKWECAADWPCHNGTDAGAGSEIAEVLPWRDYECDATKRQKMHGGVAIGVGTWSWWFNASTNPEHNGFSGVAYNTVRPHIEQTRHIEIAHVSFGYGLLQTYTPPPTNPTEPDPYDEDGDGTREAGAPDEERVENASGPPPSDPLLTAGIYARKGGGTNRVPQTVAQNPNAIGAVEGRAAALALGELALNISDRRTYFRNTDDEIFQLGYRAEDTYTKEETDAKFAAVPEESELNMTPINVSRGTNEGWLFMRGSGDGGQDASFVIQHPHADFLPNPPRNFSHHQHDLHCVLHRNNYEQRQTTPELYPDGEPPIVPELPITKVITGRGGAIGLDDVGNHWHYGTHYSSNTNLGHGAQDGGSSWVRGFWADEPYTVSYATMVSYAYENPIDDADHTSGRMMVSVSGELLMRAYNGQGEMGLGHYSNTATSSSVQNFWAVPHPLNLPWFDVQGTYMTTCARDTAGSLWITGNLQSGVHSRGDVIPEQLDPAWPSSHTFKQCTLDGIAPVVGVDQYELIATHRPRTGTGNANDEYQYQHRCLLVFKIGPRIYAVGDMISGVGGETHANNDARLTLPVLITDTAALNEDFFLSGGGEHATLFWHDLANIATTGIELRAIGANSQGEAGLGHSNKLYVPTKIADGLWDLQGSGPECKKPMLYRREVINAVPTPWIASGYGRLGHGEADSDLALPTNLPLLQAGEEGKFFIRSNFKDRNATCYTVTKIDTGASIVYQCGDLELLHQPHGPHELLWFERMIWPN